MRRHWEIIEQGRGDYGRDGMGFRLPDDPEEAYRQGCAEGYKKGYDDATKEAVGNGGMGFRGDIGGRYPQYPVRERMGYRENDDQYYDGMGERRRRDSMGRYM